MTLTSKGPLRNPQHPQSPPFLTSRHTFNKDNDTKLSGNILWVKQDHPWHQGWTCHQSLQSGNFKLLLVSPLLTPHYWLTYNKDINMKLSAYLSWGQKRSYMTSMNLSSKSPIRNPQQPPIPDMLLIKISTQNFWGIFLTVKHHYPWLQGWLCPPILQSGTLNVYQVPLPDPFSSNKDITTRLSRYLPKGQTRSSIT